MERTLVRYVIMDPDMDLAYPGCNRPRLGDSDTFA